MAVLPGFGLTRGERAMLESLAARTGHADELRRSLGLLWLDDGDDPADVADRLRVSRQTLYNWAGRFRGRAGQDAAARVADGPRAGRPPSAAGVVDPLVEAVFEADPRDLGYRSTVWTAPLLVQYLAEAHGLDVSRQAVGLAIARIRVRWKRPRHGLSRRPPAWRQSKGGSRRGSGAARGPSCSCWTRRSSRRRRRCTRATAGSASR